MRTAPLALTASLLLLATCGDGDEAPVEADATADIDANQPPMPTENWDRDLLRTELEFDVAALTATARVTFAGDASGTASLDVGDLTIDAVRAGEVELPTVRTGDRLDIGLPDDGNPITVAIDYSFSTHGGFEGYMTTGTTLTWPYWCGNLFPCHSEPADGLTFSIAVTGAPDGQTAVYPIEIPRDAPSYMAAFAVGEYTYLERGTTAAGTSVGVYHLPGGEAAALSGSEYLVDYVDFFERTLGPYSFGDELAAVAVRWGIGALGGMEHHPYYHIAAGSMGARDIHAHEVAHGWFGNGVRIACWEDFVLSEGLAEYLMVRAIEEAEGLPAADTLWADIQSVLEREVAEEDTAAYPSGCNEIDLLADRLWSRIPYEKGALFMRAVEERVGRASLDAALAAFYADAVGQARHMSDLITAIEAETGADLADLVAGWLTGLGIPS